jgi:hypothetical protein
MYALTKDTGTDCALRLLLATEEHKLSRLSHVCVIVFVVGIVPIKKFKQDPNSAMTSPHEWVCARCFDRTHVRNFFGCSKYVYSRLLPNKFGATWIFAVHVAQTTQMKLSLTSHTNLFTKSSEESLFLSSSKLFQCFYLLNIPADNHQGTMNMMA